MKKTAYKWNLQFFGMANPDLDLTDVEIKANLKAAIESGDSEAFAVAQMDMAKAIEKKILNEAKVLSSTQLSDQSVLAQRGIAVLTESETKYYNQVITGAGFDKVEQLMPATIFERVFETLRQSHPILSKIDFVNTTGVTEWITRTTDATAAWWGTLTAAITRKLEMAFKKETATIYKLSAYLPVSKSMLALGPVWLDRFVREVLFESISIALELAIVAGTGKESPIGLIRDLEGSVVNGEYPIKTAVALSDLKPATLGTKVMAPLTKNGTRTVNMVMLVVNPLDYWSKIFPSTAVLTADGKYVHGVLPIPADVVQSVAMPQGKMAAGIAGDYFMGIGSQLAIEKSESYRFLDDEVTYLAKQYANGKPKDNTSFVLFDISALQAPVV